jgi:hypothetical protein
MTMSYTVPIGLLAIVFVMSTVVPAAAQNSQRNAIIEKCLQQARTQASNDVARRRTTVYKDCMMQAGQRP